MLLLLATGGVIGPHYASSKSAIHGLVHWISSRYAKTGIVRPPLYFSPDEMLIHTIRPVMLLPQLSYKVHHLIRLINGMAESANYFLDTNFFTTPIDHLKVIFSDE